MVAHVILTMLSLYQGLASYSPQSKFYLLFVFFCMTYKLRMVFKHVKWLKIIFFEIQQLYEIQLSVFINKVLLKHSYINLFMYSPCLLSCYDDRVEL